MKTFLIIAVGFGLGASLANAQTDEKSPSAGAKAKSAARAVANEARNVGDAIVETVAPDKDARRVNVNLPGDGVQMPHSVRAGKTAFVVKNTAKEKQNFEISGEGIDRSFVFSIDQGETKTLQANLRPGKYKGYAIRKDGQERRFEIDLTVK